MTADEILRDGRRVTRAAAGSFEVFRLDFPPSFEHGVIDPPHGYVAVVLEGAVCKTFRRSSSTLARGSFMSIPAGAAHSSAFAAGGCRVLVLRGAGDRGERLLAPLLLRRRQVETAAATFLGWRIAHELESSDACSALALEGLALELVAGAGRAVTSEQRRGTDWVLTVRELLHASVPGSVSLQELGDVVGRHPAQVARAFRREHGVGVGSYARALRLEWAAGELAATDDSLARIALAAGFADQSHFTRSFRRHHGVTPARYRELLRA